MVDKQSGPEPVPRLINPGLPLREPQALERDKGCGQPVVDFHDTAKVSQLGDGLVVSEDLHGVFNAFE